MIKSTFRLTFGTTFTMLWNMVIFIVFGLTLNILLYSYLPDLCNLGDDLSWLAYLKHLAASCTTGLIVTILFMPIFPLLYVLLGYKHSIQSGIHHVYKSRKHLIFDRLTTMMTLYIQRRQAKGEPIDLFSMITTVFKKVEGLPFLVGPLLRFILENLPIVNIVKKVSQQVSTRKDKPEVVAEAVMCEIDVYINDEFLAPSWVLPSILLGLNLMIFGGITWWVG